MTVSLNGTSGIVFNDASTQNTSAFTGGFAFRNRIINGAMNISQRNGTSSVTVNGFTVFTVDRFYGSFRTSTGTATAQQVVDAPSDFINSIKLTQASVTSLAASDYYGFIQKIEGYNFADFNFGTANAKTFTFSFWVKSSVTGTYGLSFQNVNATRRSYVTTYTINAANTWEQKTITVAGDTTGTWEVTNSTGLFIQWDLGSGTDYQTSTLNAWQTNNVTQASGATRWIATSGATFYITGVQLEKGSTATSFDYRPYGTELQLCQRYLPAWIPSSSAYGTVGSGMCYATSAGFIFVGFQVPPRTPPTGLTGTPSNFRVYNASGGAVSPTALNFNTSSYLGANVQFTGASGLVAGNATIMEATVGGGSVILFTGCEL